MAEVPKNTQFLLFGFGPQMHAVMALVANLLGIITVILGIVSAAGKTSIGMSPTNWFLVTIVLFIWGLSFWFAVYFGAKEGFTK